MPISSTTRKTSPFTGNGSLTLLPFAFKVFAASDLEVIRTNTATGAKTTLTLTTDYSVALNANQDTGPGGTVTLVTPLATGYTAVVVSKIPATQAVALTNAGGFFPTVLNGVFDRLAALIQQLYERTGRTPMLPVSDTASWPEIPAAVGRANTVLGFGNDGAPALIPKADFIGPAGPAGPQGPSGGGGGGSDVTLDTLEFVDGVLTITMTDATTRSVSIGVPGGGSTAGPLTLSEVSVSNIDTDSATLSVLIGGTIPTGALMLIQYSANPGVSWLGSAEPTTAVVGTFSFNATGLTPGTTYFVRASVYSEPGGGLDTVVHASTSLGSFATTTETDSVPSYSRMVNEMDDPAEGRAMSWVNYTNNPSNVAIVGGSESTNVPAVVSAGALARGTTVPQYVIDGFGGLDPIPSQYQDSDPWPIYTPWMVFIEGADRATGLVRQHTEDNCAIQVERCIFAVYRNTGSTWQIIRDRTDLQDWYTATEDYLFANGDVEERAPTAEEGAGTVIRWTRASGNAIHGSLVRGAIGFSPTEFGNGIDLTSIVSDIRCLAVAYRIRAVPWNRSAPFNPANVKILCHVGCDARILDPHPWAIPSHVLSRQRYVTTTWDWHTAITLRDTIRQDRDDGGASVETGFTKAQALSTPITSWAA